MYQNQLCFQGANSHGQLGHGTTSEQCNSPSAIPTWTNNVVKIACGGGHTLLIDNEGKLYGCGWNHRRQLAQDEEKCEIFTRVWELSGIRFVDVSAGWDFSAAITENNIIHVWGSNSHGQLGLPLEEYPKFVKSIRLELKVSHISMGMRHTVLVDVHGNVWTSGCGKHGQLGFGEGVSSKDRFQKIDSLRNVYRVSCGQYHTLAWNRTDGELYSWGDNRYGQLGISSAAHKVLIPTKVDEIKDNVSSIKEIFTGWTNSAVLLKNGEALYWGRNNYGQLARVDPESRYNVVKFEDRKIEKLAMGSEHSICLLNDGSLWAWGWNEHGNTGIISSCNVTKPHLVEANIPRINSIFSGSAHNFVVAQCEVEE